MRKILFISIIASCVACQQPKTNSSIEGLWVNTASMTIIGKDTIMQRLPMLIEIKKDSTCHWARAFGDGAQQKVVWAKTEAKQKHSENQLEWTFAKGGVEQWEIISLDDNSMLLSSLLRKSSYREQFYRIGSKVTPDALRQFLSPADSSRFQCKLSVVPSDNPFNKYPILVKGNRFVFPDNPQSLTRPLFIEVLEYNGLAFLVIDGISGSFETWDLIEVQSIEGQVLKGDFWFKNKRQTIEIKRL